jgi:dihydrofolate reductase
LRKIVVSTFTTLDGVMEAPHEWMDGIHFQFWNDESTAYANELLFSSDALLMGRVTYEGFAPAWTERSGDPFSDRMNSIKKYVVSNTLETADWNNTEIVRGDAAAEVSKLKNASGEDILIYGSARLTDALLRAGLIDQLHIWVDPIVVGKGKRMFEEGVAPSALTLMKATPFSSGVVVLAYAPAAANT